jgi:hypothetical protein
MKVPFEIRRLEGKNVIFVDNNLFDWEIDPKAISEINNISDFLEIENIHESIRNFFIESLSCFLQKQITLKEVIESLKLGYIEI